MDDGLFDLPECECGNRFCRKCFPVLLPYAGTSGWSGSATSRQRAVSADTSGLSGARQHEVYELLQGCGEHGMTWREVADALATHHGSASGVLSVLHKEGVIARLHDTRDGCKIYVTLPCVADRQTEPHGGERRPRACSNCGHIEQNERNEKG